PAPLRDRFGFTAHLDFYSEEDLEKVLVRSAGLLGVELEGAAAVEISKRSRGTPRIANRLLRRVQDWAQVRGSGELDLHAAKSALEVFEVDERGLDRLDRGGLTALLDRFGGGPVGPRPLAVAWRAGPGTGQRVQWPRPPPTRISAARRRSSPARCSPERSNVSNSTRYRGGTEWDPRADLA